MSARILVLGAGNVGGSLIHMLLTRRAEIAAAWGVDLELAGVVRRSGAAPQGLSAGAVFTDVGEALAAVKPHIVVELVGGVAMPRQAIALALATGAHVVTANKAVLAAHGRELFAEARARGAMLLAEASVGGAIPILRTLHTSLAGDRIERILGVWNGTCNYILTQMETHGGKFAESLATAQRLGYAEADPTLDVGGGDTAHKAVVLAQAAFAADVPLTAVTYRGIEALTPEDFSVGASLGLRAKMVGLVERMGAGLLIYVGPALLPVGHPVAQLTGIHNGIYVSGTHVRELFLSGPGAGPEPTATAVLGDIIEAARFVAAGSRSGGLDRWSPRLSAVQLVDLADVAFPCYLRLDVLDRPGVLAAIAQRLSQDGISIESVLQPRQHPEAEVPIFLTTHAAPLGRIESAVRDLAEHEAVVGAPLWMPILEREHATT